MPVSLSELRRRFFDRMDEGQSQYVSPEQATDCLNEAYTVLWGIYARKDPNFFQTRQYIQPAIAVADYLLPNDFRMLTAAYIVASQGTATRVPMQRTMRAQYVGTPATTFEASGVYYPTYELYGPWLRLDPVPSQVPAFKIELWYVQHCMPLVLDSDTLHAAIYPGHEQFLLNQAVIMTKIGKEEQPAKDLLEMNAALKGQIEEDLLQRDRFTSRHVIETDAYDGWVSRYGAW